MNQEDAEHLRLLSIFHYVVAGLAALFSCLPVFHLVFGILMVSGVLPEQDPGPHQMVKMMGVLFIVFSTVIIVLGLGFSVVLALSGFYLGKRLHYMFCLVMAGIACIFMPFGTVLGVLTIIVLMRPSVKASFAGTVTNNQTT